MKRAKFLASARHDLLSIFEYIAEASGSTAVANAFVDKLRRRCNTLAGYQTMVGRSRPDLGPNIRSVPVGNYVIFLRYQRDRLEIVNIVEGHRDIHTHLDESNS